MSANSLTHDDRLRDFWGRIFGGDKSVRALVSPRFTRKEIQTLHNDFLNYRSNPFSWDLCLFYQGYVRWEKDGIPSACVFHYDPDASLLYRDDYMFQYLLLLSCRDKHTGPFHDAPWGTGKQWDKGGHGGDCINGPFRAPTLIRYWELYDFIYQRQLEEMPLWINTPFYSIIAEWRLKVGK